MVNLVAKKYTLGYKYGHNSGTKIFLPIVAEVVSMGYWMCFCRSTRAAPADAELLFRVLGERQERRAIVVMTNLPFGEWTSMFRDPRLCRVITDRLTHRATIIETGTQSIRLQDTLELAGRSRSNAAG